MWWHVEVQRKRWGTCWWLGFFRLYYFKTSYGLRKWSLKWNR